jgi:hypothetical protein
MQTILQKHEKIESFACHSFVICFFFLSLQFAIESMTKICFVILMSVLFLAVSENLRRERAGNLTILALQPVLNPNQAFTVSTTQGNFNCASGGNCFTATINCPYGTYSTSPTKWSDCFTDVYVTAGVAWKVQPSVQQASGDIVFYTKWGGLAVPENGASGPYKFQSISVDNCDQNNNVYYLRIYCFSDQCQANIGYTLSWSCGLKWQSNGLTSCDISCRKSNIPQCYYTSPSTNTLDNSVCQSAYGSFQQTFVCANGEFCSSNTGICDTGVCMPKTVSPTQKPTTVSPSFAPTMMPTAVPSTAIPSATPSTAIPSAPPTFKPTAVPSTDKPSTIPTFTPTARPTATPTATPTANPSTRAPTMYYPSPYICASITGGQQVNALGTVGDDFNVFCDTNKCLPGVQDILGRGYDITLSTGKHFAYDFNALKAPIYGFKAPFTQFRFNGDYYYKPNGNLVDASTQSETEFHTDSYVYQSVSDFSRQIGAQVSYQPEGNLEKGIGIQSKLVAKVSESVAQTKILFDAYAKTSNLNLRLLPSTSNNPLSCSASVSDRLKILEFSRTPSDFDDYIQIYGTHIITGTKIGGHIHYSAAESVCSFEDDRSIQASVSTFGSTVQGMIKGGATSTKFYSTEITKTNMDVCGGQSSAYASATDSSGWDAWVRTIYTASSEGYCGFDFNLIPMTSLARNIRMEIMLNAAIERYVNNTIITAEKSLDESVPSCSQTSSTNRSVSSSISFIPVLVFFMSLHFVL